MMMIERMGIATLEALEREAVYAQAVDGDLSKCMVDGGLFDMRTVMRAALTALLEPSEGMVNNGADHLFASANENWSVDAREVFTAMIHAALDEKEG